MTLTIEIDTLRRIDELAKAGRITLYCSDLIAFAELFASEIARARDQHADSEIQKAPIESDLISLTVEKMSFPVQDFSAPPEETEPTPGPVPMQPETPISQPEPVKSAPEASTLPPEPTRTAPENDPKPSRKDAWTDAQDAKLIQMKRGGCSIEAIAKQVGRSSTSVLARLQKLKTDKPGSCPMGRVWSSAEHATLVRMQREGKSWPEIAAKLDRTVRSVQQRYTKLKNKGLPNIAAAQEKTGQTANTERPRAQVPATKAAKTSPDTKRVPNIGDLSGLKLRQRTLVMHLANLNDDFAPIDDLDIVEGLMAGKKPAAIADELGCKPHDVAARWKSMLTDDVVNYQGNPTIDGQQDILVAARHLVKCAEGSNA